MEQENKIMTLPHLAVFMVTTPEAMQKLLDFAKAEQLVLSPSLTKQLEAAITPHISKYAFIFL